ncbi:signal peptidase I [Herbiconiux sp. P17]|uniref:signal peptidase I n=1 Tax=Herbiconiux wuyangfengii TaxID=3342794 RepID=UPI0035B77AD7
MTNTKTPAARSRLRKITGNPFVHLLAAFVVLALVQTFLVRLYFVPSGSMENTLEPGDRILVNRLAYAGGDPQTTDIVVFNASDAWPSESAPPSSNPLVYAVKWLGGVVGIGPSNDHTLVKRVIAGPGQTVSCCDAEGHVLVDGKPLNEPYTFNDFPFVAGSVDCDSVPASIRCFGEYTVPEGEYFVLGDNRAGSADSIQLCRGQPETTDACVKLVRRDDIVGRVFQIALPFGRWGSV